MRTKEPERERAVPVVDEVLEERSLLVAASKSSGVS